MAFGLKIYGPAGQTWFDSTVAVAGAPIDYIDTASALQGFTKLYPTMTGRTLKVVSLEIGGSVAGVTTDTYQGQPRLTVLPGYERQVFMVVAV